MKKEDWQRIETILNTVLTLPDQEWDAYLQKTCGDDDLIREVKSILWGIEESEKTHFLERASADHQELIDELSELNRSCYEDHYIGKIIGHYRIVEKAGSGGMGEVYRAERNDGQFHQFVAIKVLKQGYHSEEIIHRFRIEQQILANLHHPNIAQLYDAGLTDEGISYLIMEFVDGIPIDEYANQHLLSVKERLGLLIKVCNAVQYAHTNLVIHRDLKAQNILVNSEHQIKILDFGVAKLIDPASTEITLIETQPGQRLWTPHYASPEQIREGVVSTTNDVYSLGILMHKLLTDTYPFDLSGKNLLEIENIIVNQEPTTASESLGKSGHPQLVSVARGVTTQDLKKELKGDLDSIIAKALRKEPDARYESARQLAEDLDRYLHNLPVLSRKGNLQYRSRKFIRRHAVPVISAFLMLLTIVTLITYYTIQITGQRNKALVEAHRARLVTNFMVNIFNDADPYDQHKKNLTAREILDQGTKRIQKSIADPDIKATMLSALGNIYTDLGMYDKATPLLHEAMDIREHLKSSDNMVLARSYFDWANVSELSDNYTVAIDYFARASLIYHQTHNDSLYAKDILELAWVDYLTADYRIADSLATTALHIDRKIYGNNSKEVAQCDQYLAWVNNGEGNYGSADSLFRKALSLRQLLYKGNHPLIAQTLGALARNLYDAQHYDSAEVYGEKALAMSKRLFGKKHPQIAILLHGLGLIELAKHKYKKSQQYILESLNMRRAIFGDNDPQTIVSLSDLAHIYYSDKQYTKAADIFKKVTDENTKALGPDHPEVALALNNTAMCLWKAGKKHEAVSYFRKSIAVASKTYQPAHPRMVYFRKNLADLYQDLDNYQKSETLHLENFRILQDSLGLRNKRTQIVLQRLTKFYKDWGKLDKEEFYSAMLSRKKKLVSISK
ncbi:MAG TPA: serine/threonine-protein kinase [Balneolales bacterium]|nr:serine/threonine-protein kinase [Balneolales bacterium]